MRAAHCEDIFKWSREYNVHMQHSRSSKKIKLLYNNMSDEGSSDHDISTVLKCHIQGDKLNIYCIWLDWLMFLLFVSSITVINCTLFKEKAFSSKYSLMHVGTVHYHITNILFLPIYCFCILYTLAQHSGSHVGNIFVG